MGTVHPGVPKELVMKLAAKFLSRHFIETGTLLGDSAAWAATHFAKVTTIEADETLYARATARFANNPGIEVVLGKSHSVLHKILSPISEDVVFWLDGHWSGDGTAGEEHECPVLEEISAINEWAGECIVLIDDARMFMNPPKPPHQMLAWPDLAEVTGMLAMRKPRPYIGLVEDVIIAVPQSLRSEIAQYVNRQQPRVGRFWRLWK